MPGIVLTLSASGRADARNHEGATRDAIARRLAALIGYRYGGEYGPPRARSQPLYFVPADTLVFDDARRLGIRGEDQLFGAAVPHAFVATKTITHPTLDARCRTPEGWVPGFCARVADAVLAGFSAFARDDARRAAEAVLARGPVRIKRATGIGGRGQWVARDPREVEAALAHVDDAELEASGVVVEEHLHDVSTYSVGQVRVAGIVASYWGTQRLTPNNAGAEVYGGSELHIVRGGFDALLDQRLPPDVHSAVARACVYDRAAFECFAPMFASRRNYDVVEGADDAGARRCGVLEQSWRVGGASGAEVLALEAFASDPTCRSVRAATVEVYGATDAPPADAFVLFRGVDEHVGAITKYATVVTDAHTR